MATVGVKGLILFTLTSFSNHSQR